MPKIAISYRRDNSIDITGRIFDRLTVRYGRKSVFRDIDSIPPGRDFREYIQETLGDSDLLMVVVGPRWMGEERRGKARIHSETDYVRTEVEIALTRRIPVIPLLVGGSDMPEPGELPESIRDFAYHNAVAINSGRDFDHHMNGLIRSTDGILHDQTLSPSGGAERRDVIEGITQPASEGSAKAPREEPRARIPRVQSNLVLQVVGGAMIAQGIVHVAWFSTNVLTALDAGVLKQMFHSIWMFADMIFGFGGLGAGIGTILGKTWGRLGGITICMLLIGGGLLWFINSFDKDIPRLLYAATGLGVILGLLGAYMYVFRWPVPDSR